MRLLAILLSAALGCALLAGAALLPTEPARVLPLDELRTSLTAARYQDVETEARRLLGRIERESPEAAGVLDLLVEALWRGRKGAEPDTLELAERVVRIRTAGQGPSHPDLARSLDNLANVLRVRGDIVRSRELFQRALDIREAALGPVHQDVASSLNSLGWVLYLSGEFDAAQTHYERSIAMKESVLGADDPEVAKSLNNLGVLRRSLGDYSGAREQFERALSIFENVHGSDHQDVAATLNGLAGLEKKMGRFIQAREAYERALAIWRQTLGPRNPQVAAGLSNLADLHRRMGDYATARRLYREALAIVEEAHGAEHPEIAAHLNSMAMLFMSERSFTEALPLLDRALRICEESLGPENLQVAQVLFNLGHLYLETGDLASAKEVLERTLAIRREKLEPDHPEIGAALVNLGHVAEKEHADAQASELFSQALAIYEASLGPDHPDVARCLVYRSDALEALRRHAEALEAALRADEIGREHLRLTVRALPEREALAYAAVCPAGHDQALSIAASDASAADGRQRIWDAVIRSRAMVLDEMRARHGSVAAAPGRSEALARASEQLANLLVRGPTGESGGDYRQLRLHASDKRDMAERELAEVSQSFRRHHEASRVGFAEVRASLPPSAALLAYVLYERAADPAPVRSYVALVLRSRTGEPAIVPLGPAEAIDARVRRWGEEIGRAHGQISSRSAEQRYREASEELRRAIWDPLVPYLGSAKRVFVVPDGTLQRVNLATLADGESYLIESGPRLHYLSAERDLVRPPKPRQNGLRLLVMGGALFGDPEGPEREPTVGEACAGLSGLRFASLPGTSREAAMVAQIWGGGRPDAEARPARTLLGAEASEAAFKREAHGHAVVHVATHGFSVVDRCTTPESRWLAEGNLRALAPAPGEETLWVSGLALSGANLRGTGDGAGEDGVLTALEIASVDLTGTEWVVLSGCDTGLGEIRAGEGVLGLRRAFDIAGAQTLIMSLWPVGDEWTQEWMRELYRLRVEGASTIDAVHGAGLEVLHRLRAGARSAHPFYWGAFVAAGGWD